MAGVVTCVSSAARTSTNVSGSIAKWNTNDDTLVAVLNVTAASGVTPTLTVSLEWSLDGTTFATSSDTTFAQMTTTGTVIASFEWLAPYVRFRWTIGGTTPSFTFDVTGASMDQ